MANGRLRYGGMVTAWLCLVGMAFAPSVLGGRARTFSTGNDLLGYCEAPVGTAGYSSCIAYVAGVADALATGSAIVGYRSCYPENARITVDQAAAVAAKFIRDNPKIRHEVAAVLAARALSQAFPCRR